MFELFSTEKSSLPRKVRLLHGSMRTERSEVGKVFMSTNTESRLEIDEIERVIDIR